VPEGAETLGTVAGAAGDPGDGASAPAEPGADSVPCPAGGRTFGTVAGAFGVAAFVTGAGRAGVAPLSLAESAVFGTVAGALADAAVPYQLCKP
jgi:hypothetical protein